ncbi:PQQ-dependent sugar dehydrogenase [Pantanalinema rosaneae CENA516]|uniref:PQQ-dependent sugar dehydrogenase n=1 Tax=Pantanalinema rosaneae TaxID=1620701 RepID=UPI003D6F5535
MPDLAGNSLDTATLLALTTNPQSWFDQVTPLASDYYRFDLASRSHLTLSLSDLTADADLLLLDSSGTPVTIADVVQSSTNPGTTTELLTALLDPGTYYLQISAAPTVTTANYSFNAISRPVPDPIADVGMIQGSIWNDLNGDGIWEQFEPGLAGWTVYLDQNQNQILDTDELAVLTDATGNYLFTDLIPGTYTVAQVLQPGWQAIAPNATGNSYTIELSAEGIAAGIDFGNRADFAPISLTPIVSGVRSPTFITHAGDGSDRVFVVEQGGRIQILQNGSFLPTPFLDISSRVQTGGEQGLLSVAFSPNYATNGQFYVYYTNRSGNNVVARYQISSNGNVADPASEQIVITINHPTYTNHNGGQLAFGQDGYLYIGTGDGGGGGDPNNNAQNPNSLLGKILRIDVESPGTTTYTIPTTNPFLTATDPNNLYRDEIWALGLRNPWRFSFDRVTGDLYIADVGQSAYEEVNFQPASSAGGENYGWRQMEGSQPYILTGDPSNFVPPVTEYNRTQGVSITGGYVYRGSAESRLQGIYFYGDFGNGRIWALRRNAIGWESQLVLDSPYSLSSFGEDEQGNLYVADYSRGGIYQITL